MRVAGAIASSSAIFMSVAALAGCVAGDENNSTVESLMDMNQDALHEFVQRTPDSRNAELLISSWKRHPPSDFLNEEMRSKDVRLAREILERVGPEDGYIVTVEMIEFFIEMRDAGSLASTEIKSLDIREVCSRNAPGNRLCSERIGELLSVKKAKG